MRRTATILADMDFMPRKRPLSKVAEGKSYQILAIDNDVPDTIAMVSIHRRQLKNF